MTWDIRILLDAGDNPSEAPDAATEKAARQRARAQGDDSGGNNSGPIKSPYEEAESRAAERRQKALDAEVQRPIFEALYSPAEEARSNYNFLKGERSRRRQVQEEYLSDDNYSAKEQAKDIFEEEMFLRRRNLEVLQERHKIEGAAFEEMKITLEYEKERRQWAQRMKEERHAQDPQEAAKDALSGWGGILSNAGMGGIGRWMGLASKGIGMEQETGAFSKIFGSMGGGAAGEAGALAGEAGAAGAAGGGAMGSLAAAAGPAGLIVMAAQEIKQQMIGTIRAGRELAMDAGQGAVSLAGNDFGGAFEKASDMVIKSVEKLPGGGEVLAEAMRFVTDQFKIFGQVQEAFIRQGREKLSPFSGDLQASFAQADVRSMMGDMREAQAVGPNIARLVEAQSRANDAMREIADPIKQILTEALAFFMEAFASIVEWGRDIERSTGFLQALSNNFKIAMDRWREILGFKGDVNDLDMAKLFDRFLDNPLLDGDRRIQNQRPGGNMGRLGGGF